MWDIAITSLATLLVTVDPVGNVPMFLALTPQGDAAYRQSMAVKGTVIGGVILLGFAFLGDALFDAMGISYAAFRIAGGILLLLLATDMVLARSSGLRATTESESAEARAKTDISTFPLAIPLIAGPGAMTSVVLLIGRAQGTAQTVAVLASLGAVLVLQLALLLAANRTRHLLGVTGTNVVSRVFGIVLAALAVQFIVDGVREAFFSV